MKYFIFTMLPLYEYSGNILISMTDYDKTLHPTYCKCVFFFTLTIVVIVLLYDIVIFI